MPASKKTNSDSAAKPKSPHKRRKASINYNPRSKKKRTVPSSSKDISDFVDFKIKEKTQHQENENSSELSSGEESSKINQDPQPSIVGNRIPRTLSHRKTPLSSQSTLSTIPGSGASQGTSPEVAGEEQHSTGNDSGIQIQTDKNFIQQQVQLLATPFTLQDCPGLAGKQNKKKNGIPHDVIHDALRKLNRKMDDEIHKHLNRQCQRTVLSELLEIEKDSTVYESHEHRENYVAETMSVLEILEKCSKELQNTGDTDHDLLRRYSNSIAKLQKMNDEMKEIKQRIASYESNNLMVLEVEYLAKETTERSLQNEVERTNKLVNQIVRLLRRQDNSA